MNNPYRKIRQSARYYYYKQKNCWSFPKNIAHLSGGKMAQGSYEPAVSATITDYLQKGDSFIDIGANVGYFSRLAANEVGDEGIVYAFEIEFDNYCALTQNIKDYSNIHGFHLAISDDNSFVNVNYSSHSACHSIVDTDNFLQDTQFTVPSMTLDHFWKTYLQKNPIDLLKIDVEGAEPLVFKGMVELLDNGMVKAMIIEFCPAILQNAGFKITDIYRTIASDYSITVIDKKYAGITENGFIDSLNDFNKLTNRLLNENGVININLFCSG